MEPAQYTIKVKAGTTFSKSFTLTDANGNPRNLTGYTGYCQVRTRANGDILADATVGVTPATGKFVLSLTPTQTLALYGQEAVFDVYLKSPGETICPVEGQVEIAPNVTVIP